MDTTNTENIENTESEVRIQEQEPEQVEKNKKTEKKAKGKKKKATPLGAFLKVIGIILLLVIVALAAWILYSGLNRKKSLSLLPPNYGLYLHTDSVWEALNPLLDLQAADILLATEEFSSFRSLFMELRQSQLRENKLLALAAARPVDLGLYFDQGNKTNFVAVVDMGFLSAATRLSKLWIGRLPLEKIFPEGVTMVQDSGGHHFELNMDFGTIYLKNHYNTVIASSSRELFQKAVQGNNDVLYTSQELELLTLKTENPLQIIADASTLAQAATEQSPVLQKIVQLIHKDSKAHVSFGITDKKIDVKLQIPLDLDKEQAQLQELAGVRALLQEDSSLPLLLSQLGNNIQYYTILNIGSLMNLKEAAFPLLPASLNATQLWDTGDSVSTNLFGVNLDELVFSWAGQECAILGIEGLKDPVIALEVKDENMRQFIFEQLLSSIILKDDTSLILNGVRLPRLQLPVFLQGILKLLNLKLPSPYYMVHKNFIYFSESPESLSALFASMQSGQRLSNNESWKIVAENHKKETSVSLFYDLEHETPFFLRGDNVVIQILELYAMGLLNLQVQDSTLICQLSASSRPSGQLRSLPGFPMELEGKAAQIHKVAGKNGKLLFWVENNTILKVLDVGSMSIRQKEFRSPILVAPAAENSAGAAIWAVTAEGAAYLLTTNLADVPNFPQLTGGTPSTHPLATEQGLIQPMDDDSICFVSPKGAVKKLQLELTGSIMAAPSLLKSEVAFYDKGFSGGLLVVDTEKQSQILRQQVFGIAYGSPALLESKKTKYLGFITQAGRLSLWRFTEGKDGTEEPLQQIVDASVKGVFFTNLVSNGNYFFALSAEGQLFRIATDGTIISVKIPNVTARNGVITVLPNAKTGAQNIYLGVDGNVLYGFNENLELLQGFPLAGSGIPIFVDVNSDGNDDCLALTIDNKLNGWNLR